MKAHDARALARAAAEIAVEAGALLAARVQRRRTIRHKGTIDLVTEADHASERLITRRIRARFPDHDLLGEERARLDRGARFRWIIDPLDGTINYAHRVPIWGVSIAVADRGSVVAGAVRVPMLDETYLAWTGGGAWLNGRRLSVSRTTRMVDCLMATGLPYDLHRNPGTIYHRLAAVGQQAQGLRRPGSASFDLACVAAGRFDGFWELRLAPWDVAAGYLLIQEAGGRMTDDRGGPFNLYGDSFVASNGRIHQRLLALLDDRRPLETIVAAAHRPTRRARTRGRTQQHGR